jgi:hypothetical protein
LTFQINFLLRRKTLGLFCRRSFTCVIEEHKPGVLIPEVPGVSLEGRCYLGARGIRSFWGSSGTFLFSTFGAISGKFSAFNIIFTRFLGFKMLKSELFLAKVGVVGTSCADDLLRLFFDCLYKICR